MAEGHGAVTQRGSNRVMGCPPTCGNFRFSPEMLPTYWWRPLNMPLLLGPRSGRNWCGSKSTAQAGVRHFSPWLHFPGFHLGYVLDPSAEAVGAEQRHHQLRHRVAGNGRCGLLDLSDRERAKAESDWMGEGPKNSADAGG